MGTVPTQTILDQVFRMNATSLGGLIALCKSGGRWQLPPTVPKADDVHDFLVPNGITCVLYLSDDRGKKEGVYVRSIN